LPDSVGNFYRDYQRPLTVVGAIIASIIALKLLSGVLDTFNEIPFFEPFFQLIGISYSTWFIYRYLLNAGSRQELWQIIDDYKAQVFGNKKP
ncbi:MAG TPA: CAAD domain-containing protein, partial [Phormidium sp.]